MQEMTIDYNGVEMEIECDVRYPEEESRDCPALGGEVSVLSVNVAGVDITEIVDLDAISDHIEVLLEITTKYNVSKKNKRHAIKYAEKLLKEGKSSTN